MFEPLSVQHPVLNAPGAIEVGFFRLGQPDGRMQIAHPVVEPDVMVHVIARGIQCKAKVLVVTAFVGQTVVIGYHHAAFAGGDILIGEERKGRNF